jgi:hypothetical protein
MKKAPEIRSCGAGHFLYVKENGDCERFRHMGDVVLTSGEPAAIAFDRGDESTVQLNLAPGRRVNSSMLRALSSVPGELEALSTTVSVTGITQDAIVKVVGRLLMAAGE